MSAVVEFVEDVGKAVGNVVEAVGDAVENVGEVIVDTVEYVAENPEIIVIAVAAPYAIAAAGAAVGASAATISLVTQPITAAVISASQGGDLEDIGKAALGAYIAPTIARPVAAATGSAIGTGSAAQVALANAVGGAVGSAAGAAAVGADIGEAALLGAAGSAGASLARSGAAGLGADQTGKAAGYTADIGEALGRGAVTGDIAGELIGAGVGTLIGEGQRALDDITTPTKTAATKPAPAPFGSQVGEQMAGMGETGIAAPTSIATRPEFATRPGEEGDIVIKYTDRDGIVTYRKDVTSTLPSGEKTGYTIVYDPQTDTVDYEFVSAGQTGSTGGLEVSVSKTRPGEEAAPAATKPAGTTAPSPDVRTGRVTDIAKAATGGRESTAPASGESTAPTPPAGPETSGAVAGGRGEGEMVGDGEREMAGGTRPVEGMTGTELLGDAMAGEEGGAPREGGEGAGEGGGGGEGLAEQPADLEAMTDEELLALLEDSMDFDVEETPLVPPDDIGEFQPLDARTAGGSRRGTPYQSSISARAVGSSPTAAIVGNKEPIFGGDEGVQSEAWNTRSLRLRKALGI